MACCLPIHRHSLVFLPNLNICVKINLRAIIAILIHLFNTSYIHINRLNSSFARKINYSLLQSKINTWNQRIISTRKRLSKQSHCEITPYIYLRENCSSMHLLVLYCVIVYTNSVGLLVLSRNRPRRWISIELFAIQFGYVLYYPNIQKIE